MTIRLGTIAGLVALAACLLGAPAQAQIGSERYSAIVLDNRTGNVLVAANPDETRHPASLTKMMTLYMVFDALKEGRLTLASPVVMSEEAASRPPSKLGVLPGASITVEQAILALVTRSANDVAAAIGERLGGSEERFGQMMTQRARTLGMTRTTFRNASGLPDLDQVTTARDMATLGTRLLQDHGDRYHYFGMTHAQFGGIRIRNHNRMLGAYEGVDGIKTGYIRDSGFNIVTSASRGGQRLVGAVFGGMSWVERDAHMAALLDQGFSQLGVTPRVEMARAPILMRQAEAATPPRAQARVQPRATNRVAARPAASRNAVRSESRATAATSRSAARSQPTRAQPAPTLTRTAPAPVLTRTAPAPVLTRTAPGSRGGMPIVLPPRPAPNPRTSSR